MNGIWIIKEDITVFCFGMRLEGTKLQCFTPDTRHGFSFDCTTPLAAKRTKREIDDTIMRGDRYYRLEV